MLNTDIILGNRYQVQEILSNKAGRQTVLATDLQNHIPVIIKILQFSENFKWNNPQLFEREASTLKNLNHPNIPKYIDYFNIDDVDYGSFALVQSYIEAPSLETLVNQGCNFSESEVIELADRLLELLIYLHQQFPPIIHRDIKPSNILLNNRSGNSIGDVYLINFMSVQTIGQRDNRTITIAGSDEYIPTEQLSRHTRTASDLYSLGMTLVYLLTGSHPSELPQVGGKVAISTDISRTFEKWLQKITNPQIEQRFSSAKNAQIALNSEDFCEDFKELRPAYTRINLEYNHNRLEINYPDFEDNLFILYSLYFLLFLIGIPIIIFLIIGFLFLFWILLALTVNSGLLLSAFIFASLVIVPISLLIAFLNFARSSHGFLTAISSNKVEFNLVVDHNCLYKYKEPKQNHDLVKIFEHPRSQIQKLVYSSGYRSNQPYGEYNRLDKTTNPAMTKPKLYLYCGDIKYSFPTHFSEAELWWLGHALSNFLNCELQVINSGF